MPIDVYAEQDEEEEEDEPAPSIIAATSEAPTCCATWISSFDFRPPRNMLPGVLEELSPELARNSG